MSAFAAMSSSFSRCVLHTRRSDADSMVFLRGHAHTSRRRRSNKSYSNLTTQVSSDRNMSRTRKIERKERKNEKNARRKSNRNRAREQGLRKHELSWRERLLKIYEKCAHGYTWHQEERPCYLHRYDVCGEHNERKTKTWRRKQTCLRRGERISTTYKLTMTYSAEVTMKTKMWNYNARNARKEYESKTTVKTAALQETIEKKNTLSLNICANILSLATGDTSNINDRTLNDRWSGFPH